tara:strand:- start:216 stop:371 length:156 start_codon:yes stop_codon:yes gene_type:complete
MTRKKRKHAVYTAPGETYHPFASRPVIDNIFPLLNNLGFDSPSCEAALLES